MQSGNQGHGKVCCIEDVVYVVVFVWRFEDRILERLYCWMVYRYSSLMVLEFVASVAAWWFYLPSYTGVSL